MASVQKEKSGNLCLMFRFKGQQIKENFKLKDTPRNRKALEKIAISVQYEIDNFNTLNYSKYFPAGKKGHFFGEKKKDYEFFKDYILKWYESTKTQWRKSTLEAYKANLFCHIIPFFEDL